MRGLASNSAFDALGIHIHAEHAPVGIPEDARREMMADEAIDTEDQNFRGHD